MSDNLTDSSIDKAVFTDSNVVEPLGSAGEDKVEDFIRKDLKWWKNPHLVKLNFALALCCLASTNNGYDGSMLNGLQSLDSWYNTINPSRDSVKLGALSNGTIFGGIVSLPFAPFVCDRYGRKAAFLVGNILMVIGAVLQGASTNFAFFLCARLVLGFGNGFMVVATPSLMSEIAFPSHRSVVTAFYNTCWYLGAFLAAWITYGTNKIGNSDTAWKVPSYLQGFFPVLQVACIWLIPESPRYYISKGQTEKAVAMLRKCHTGNSEDPMDMALVDFEVKEIQTAIELEKLNTKSSYSDFYRLKNFRKRLFLVIYIAGLMQLSGNGLVSYYLNKVLSSIGITDSDRQLQINGFLMMFNMFISMFAAFTVQYLKRRLMFLISLGSMLTCYILWTVLSALAAQRDYPASLSNGVLAFIFLYYAAYDIGLNGLPILYLTEILPYTHRAKGLNIFSLAQTCALIFNGYVNPVAMDAIEWKYYIVWTCYLAVELVVVFFTFPETRFRKDVTLEEIGQIFGDPVADDDEVLIREGKVEVHHHEVSHQENVEQV